MRTTTFTFFDNIPDGLREMPKKRGAEALGLVLAAAVGAGALALLSWSAADPSLNHATSAPIHNWLGKPGAVAADIAMQFFGIASALLLGAPAFWGWRLITNRRLDRVRLRLCLGLISLASGAGAASLAPAPGSWPLPTGLGGVVGDALLWAPRKLAGGSKAELMIFGAVLAATAILTMSAAVGYRRDERDNAENADARPTRRAREIADFDEDDNAGDPGFGLVSLGALIHTGLALQGSIKRMFSWRPSGGKARSTERAPWLDRQSPSFEAPIDDFEPNLERPSAPSPPKPPAPGDDGVCGRVEGDARRSRAQGRQTRGQGKSAEFLQAGSLRVSAAGHARRAKKTGLQNLRGRPRTERPIAGGRAR